MEVSISTASKNVRNDKNLSNNIIKKSDFHLLCSFFINKRNQLHWMTKLSGNKA